MGNWFMSSEYDDNEMFNKGKSKKKDKRTLFCFNSDNLFSPDFKQGSRDNFVEVIFDYSFFC